MNGFQKLIQSKTFFPVLVSLALVLVLIFLPTGYEGALSYQNADRVPALVLSTDESDIYDTGLVRTGDQRCRVRILGGQFAGTEADAVNRLSGSLAQDKLFSAGEKAFVVVSHSGDAITTVYMTARKRSCSGGAFPAAPSDLCKRNGTARHPVLYRHHPSHVEGAGAEPAERI